jgi:hypothetical protein
MLLGNPLAKLHQLVLPGNELLLFDAILLGQLDAQMGDRLRRFCRRQCPGDLSPQLLSQEARFQCLPV